MDAKPSHLSDAYAAQFADDSVARAYATRPPYPAGVPALVASLITARPRVVLELGAGTGDLTIGLAPLVERLEAIEPSASMMDAGRQRMAGVRNVTWILAKAEAYEFKGPYAAVVAAESLHWMDWEVLFPQLCASLARDGVLVLVCDRRFVGMPWEARLKTLIAQYSTNQEFKAYDLVTELSRRGLFAETGRQQVISSPFFQTLEDYVESFHSRNGFSRQRMGDRAEIFDRELLAMLRADVTDDGIEFPVETTVVWGRPLSGGVSQDGLDVYIPEPSTTANPTSARILDAGGALYEARTRRYS
jgi:SAM-dependent methyltransferase